MKSLRLAAVLVLFVLPTLLPAQNSAPPAKPESPEHFYRLNLVVQDLSDAGKVINARSYLATIHTGEFKSGFDSQSIRTGAKVPIATSTAARPGVTEWQYVDVGVSFDIHTPKETGDALSFRLVADISSMGKQLAGDPALASQHVIRQNKWDSTVLIPVGKPTVVYSSDDLDDRGKMQIEVTATRLD